MDCYEASLTMWPFPDAVNDALANAMAESQIDALIVEELLQGGGTAIGDARCIGTNEQTYTLAVDEQKGRILTIDDAQAGYGTTQFMDHGLPETLAAQDIAYVCADDGAFEFYGEEFSWNPSLDRPRCRQRLKSGQDALGVEAFASLRSSSSTSRGGIDLVRLGELVLDHFEFDPLDWWPGKPALDEVELPVVEVKPSHRSRQSALAG